MKYILKLACFLLSFVVTANAACAFRAAGAAASAASGNVSPGVPAGTTTNDIMVIIVGQHDNVVSTYPAGWTSIDAENNTVNSRGEILWKRAGASELSPTVTHAAGDSITSQISSFSGCITTGSPVDAFLGTLWTAPVDATSYTATANAITTTKTNEMIVFGGMSDDNSSPANAQYANWSGSNPTFTEAFDSTTTLGADSGVGMSYGVKTDASTTGNRTVDLSLAPAAGVADRGVLWLVALLNPAGGVPKMPLIGVGP